MSETLTTVEQNTTTTQQPAQAAPAIEFISPFSNDSWTEAPAQSNGAEPAATPQTQTQPAEITTTQPAATQTQTQEEFETLDPKDWLKREFEIDDPELLKQQIKEYRELKEKPQTPAEIAFANEQSKQIYELLKEGKSNEVIEVLNKQRQIEQYTSSPVTAETAENIIKLGMKLKYPELTDDQINFQYKQDYGVPKMPVQKADELEDEFNERMEAWKEQAAAIDMKKTIAATMTKPELEKLKAQIVLPEISKPTAQANEPTAEQLAEIEKQRQNFLNKLESDYNKFEGFATKVKDESVEIPVSFNVPQDEKVAIKDRFKAGFDLNDYLDKRWSDANGNQRVEQIISDFYVLENLDKILSGVANNAANQRLVEFRKQISNTTIKGVTPQQTFNHQESGQAANPFADNAWSEKPPAFIN